jgi:Pyruvate/2-oxoacid:ferredoxin oxidoreductase gamma subunit
MKRFALLIAMFLVGAWAQAAGLPFAVESLKKAQEASSKDPSKHVLVFYTSEN